MPPGHVKAIRFWNFPIMLNNNKKLNCQDSMLMCSNIDVTVDLGLAGKISGNRIFLTKFDRISGRLSLPNFGLAGEKFPISTRFWYFDVENSFVITKFTFLKLKFYIFTHKSTVFLKKAFFICGLGRLASYFWRNFTRRRLFHL